MPNKALKLWTQQAAPLSLALHVLKGVSRGVKKCSSLGKNLR